MEERLMDLEIKVAFVEKHVSELDELVREMHELLARLRTEVASIAEQLQEDARGGSNRLIDEKPPHY